MIRIFYFIRLALHNLKRGGQRVIVALMCITFGVMALVAMSMLAKSIVSKVVISPAEMLGADISMGRSEEETVSAKDVAQLASLQKSGSISQYTLIAFSSSIMFHTPGSGQNHFISNGLGIEPEKYPLAGVFTIGEPGSTGLSTLLQQPGDVVVTRDVAEQFDLQVGDPIVLADLKFGTPVGGTVRGIAYDTPNHQGQKIYFSMKTAEKLANGQPVVNTVMVNAPQATSLVAQLEETGWSIGWVAGRDDDKAANLWVIGLRGAGILGVLVGGIGIANTMQVLLRRRQKEIAIWKTLGFRESDLRLIFSFEAGILGLAGSMLGAGLGVLVSMGLLETFRRTSTLLYEWVFSWTPPLIGVLVGTLSTIIFAYWAIVVSSQASPMALLRNEKIDLRRLPGWKSAGLGLLLALLFILVTSLAMGSITSGIGVLAAIVFGLGVLVGVFKGLLWIFARVFRLRSHPVARMGINSLRRKGISMIFAMIALFIGVLSMSLALLVMQLSISKTAIQPLELSGSNITLLTSGDQEQALRDAIQTVAPVSTNVGYRTALDAIHAQGEADSDSKLAPILIGRSEPGEYVIQGAKWGSQPGGVYVPQWWQIKAGRQVEITFRDGSRRMLTVAGTFDFNYDSAQLYPPMGLLMSADDFKLLTLPDSLTFSIRVDPAQLVQTSEALSEALPQASVINLEDYAARFMQGYRNLYLVPMAMAGLAFLAGLLLTANSVSLALLERRYEIGILKTIGYSRRQVLSIFMIEYGLAGLISTGAGVFIIQSLLALFAIGNRMPAGTLLLSLPSMLLVLISGIGLTVLTVFGVTRKPTQLPPSVVLNDRT